MWLSRSPNGNIYRARKGSSFLFGPSDVGRLIFPHLSCHYVTLFVGGRLNLLTGNVASTQRHLLASISDGTRSFPYQHDRFVFVVSLLFLTVFPLLPWIYPRYY